MRGSSLMGDAGLDVGVKRDATQYVRTLNLSQLIPDPQQPRRHFDPQAIEDLARSIETTGFLLHPMVVRLAEADEGSSRSAREPEKYYIVAGEQRWMALRLLKRTRAECSVISTQDPYEIRLIQTAENRQRYALDVEEEAANALMTLELGRARGKNNRQVAEDMGYPQASFSRLLAINSAPEPVRKVLRDGRTRNPELAGLLAAMAELEDPALFVRATEGDLISLHLAREVGWALKNGFGPGDILARLDVVGLSAQSLGLRPDPKAIEPAAPEQPAVPPEQDAAGPDHGAEPASGGDTTVEVIVETFDPGQPTPPPVEEAPQPASAGANSDPAPSTSTRRASTIPESMVAPERGEGVAYTQFPAAAPGGFSTSQGPVTELGVRIGEEVVTLLLTDPRSVGTNAAVVFADGRIEVLDLSVTGAVLLSLSRNP
ncbi:ParB/RepB/Spo0J family partition protein [Sinimarinibacterium sp. CAU 1509]|uniref:ParB/RepB/Spo0J family partition protein n=1 Tax=Sinimarinibacterium sp. CAU 1509 TaxID=2562283 RepID=UPI0010ABDF51|nr:ParB/RepB/Spo0J family partition protein [Sinimarinibacterium sp. CAU 1509]TJY57272.1 ParB/RepB/Spo0J family partition protein [Sinimarinibacterium sp. CAU 1509]